MATRKFVPIADIDGYISALRREGRTSEEDLGEIYKMHTLAIPAAKPAPAPAYVPIVKSGNHYTGFYVKMAVVKGRVRVKIVFPFAEFYAYYKDPKHQGKMCPIDIWIRCLALNGASREYCEDVFNKHTKYMARF
jgi:hypothetical protein